MFARRAAAISSFSVSFQRRIRRPTTTTPPTTTIGPESSELATAASLFVWLRSGAVDASFGHGEQQQRRWASVLVVSDSPTSTLLPGVQSAVTAAQQISAGGDNNEVVLLTVGNAGPPTQIPQGVKAVWHCSTQAMALPESIALAIQHVVATGNIVQDCQAVVAPATKAGSSFIPRAAALLQVSPISDVLQIIDAGKFVFRGSAPCLEKS